MSDFPISLPLLLIPFQLVLIQVLVVVVAIALESTVFHRMLQYPPRKSVEYAISLNLFSLFIGWFFFLTVMTGVPLPTPLEQDVINLILFDQWSSSIVAWLIITGLMTFFGTLLIEVIGFIYLRPLRDEKKATAEDIIEQQKSSRSRSYQSPRLLTLGDRTESDPIYVLLVANSTSYSAITAILLLLRFGVTVFPMGRFPLL
ncbi:MAG: hypothetical protein VKJ64_15610 [Leptolyngbyaceae bacterium]|nr:hypothetical protein [Leptolyngbyaceae bacterium]